MRRLLPSQQEAATAGQGRNPGRHGPLNGDRPGRWNRVSFKARHWEDIRVSDHEATFHLYCLIHARPRAEREAAASSTDRFPLTPEGWRSAE